MTHAEPETEVAMKNFPHSIVAITVIALGGVMALAGDADAKSFPKTKKQCSHVITQVTVSGPAILRNQLKQQAIAKWEAQTGANANIAGQKQFSCIHTSPKYVTCTFSARVCTIKKIFYPTAQPPMKRPGNPALRVPLRMNALKFAPRKSFGGRMMMRRR